jgi:DHA1 family bicyclomycin/chloramphenicol resistance-like MFS transporter
MAGWCGFVGTLVLLFLFLSCIGLTNPNASALALEPFSKNAGSASALLGFFQLGMGAVISTGISAGSKSNSLPIVAILSSTAAIALVILLAGWRRAQASPRSEDPGHAEGKAHGYKLAAPPIH